MEAYNTGLGNKGKVSLELYTCSLTLQIWFIQQFSSSETIFFNAVELSIFGKSFPILCLLTYKIRKKIVIDLANCGVAISFAVQLRDAGAKRARFILYAPVPGIPPSFS